jgi:hypothetical protein
MRITDHKLRCPECLGEIIPWMPVTAECECGWSGGLGDLLSFDDDDDDDEYHSRLNIFLRTIAGHAERSMPLPGMVRIAKKHGLPIRLFPDPSVWRMLEEVWNA